MADVKAPPQNIDAEQSILGSMIKDPDTLPIVTEMLSPNDFYRYNHGLLFKLITELYNKGKPTDLISVCEEMDRKKVTDRIGGKAYVAQLESSVATTAAVEHYAKLVKELAIARRVINAAQKIAEQGYSKDYGSIEEYVHNAEALMFEASRFKERKSLVPVRDFLLDHMDTIDSRRRMKGVTGIPTGFEKLDLWTAGWQSGEMIIIAGRPSMGKTSWALQCAKDAALRHGKKVAVFMLEVSKEQAAEKMLINEGLVDGQDVRTGLISDEEWDELYKASERLYEAGIYIDDSGHPTVPEIRSKCRRMQAEVGLDMVVIDYLQLIKCHVKVDSRWREVAEISSALRVMAKELDVPVLVLSQLNRAPESRKNHKPQMSDLRESGNLEQDAHVIILLHRPEYYEPNNPDAKGKAEIIVAKQKNGPTGIIEVSFKKEFTRFAEIERWQRPPREE